MGRAPCCEKMGLKRGPWSPEEDQILINFIKQNGYNNWRALPKKAGLLRCGKSCRLRWTNYLRPDIKRGAFSHDEEETIIKLHELLGNRWSAIAARLPGRTDNEIKNVWHTHLKKRLNQNQASKEIEQKSTISFGNEPPISLNQSPGDHVKSKGFESRPVSPLPCSAETSYVSTENADNRNNNNDVDNSMFAEPAFSENLFESLSSNQEFLENIWNLDRNFEVINGVQPPQEVQFPLCMESASSSCSDTHDIMDFWTDTFMRDGDLLELQDMQYE